MEHAQVKEIQSEVREMFPNTEFPDVWKEPIMYGMNPKLMPDRMAVVTKYKGEEHVSYIGSHKYEILTHEQVVKNALETASLMRPTYGDFELVPKLYNNGTRLDFNIQFTNKPVKVQKGDEYNPMIKHRNSYDGMLRAEASAWTLRCVCDNGMCLMDKKFGHKQRHLDGSLNYAVLAEKLLGMLEKLEETMSLYRAWKAATIDPENVQVLFNELPLPQKHRAALLDVTESGSKLKLSEIITLNEGEDEEGKKMYEYVARQPVNAYQLFNTTTQYVQHGGIKEEKASDVLPVIGDYFRNSYRKFGIC